MFHRVSHFRILLGDQCLIDILFLTFASGGCRVGKLDIKDDSEKDVKGDEKHKECVSKLRDSVKKRAEKCIQEKLDTDFELPPFVKYTPIGNL